MAAADPPPPPFSEGDPDAPDPADAVGGLSKNKSRQRIRTGRFLTRAPMPPPEIEGPPASAPAPVPPRPEPPAVPAPILDGALAAVVLALAAFLASFAATNADLWLNLAAGRLVAHGKFPFGLDPFSAAPGAVWINHAWLFDLFQYLLYRPGGALLVAAKAGLVVALAVVLLAIRRRRGSGGLGPAAATTLVLLAISPLLALRSAVASYLLFAALLLILHWRRPSPSASEETENLAGARARTGPPSWQLPAAVGILFVLWVNLDGGFVFGLMLLGVWTVGAVAQRILPLGEDGDDPGEAPHPPRVMLAACGAALVGCLINPYHVHAFRWPSELAILTVPDAIRADPFVKTAFRGQFLPAPFGPGYMDQVGPVAATAVYILLGLSLASFAVNTAGWRWRRVLAWTAFACLATTVGRTVPYVALIAGPATVLNLQAVLGRRRTDWAERPNRRAAHLRAVLAATTRIGLLLTVAVLLALAWPGWLGADAHLVAAPSRRVAWRIASDPTLQRLAERLDGWYKSGDLREDAAHGFHIQPEFSFYCAWFCPAEKGILDPRLTAPPDVLADYLAARRALVALGTPSGSGHPAPPDELLRKLGTTHIVFSGGEMFTAPPFFLGLGAAVFTDPVRYPVWAIDGRGVISGWGDSYPKLRMDPVRLAVGPGVEPLPAPPAADAPAPPVGPLDRYLTPPAPPPVEAAEASLWLAYREAIAWRGGNVAIPAVLYGAELLRLAPTGQPMVLSRIFDLQYQVKETWRKSREGKAGRAANLLAIRSARRAIRANPEDPEAYGRLVQAYSNLDTDPLLGHFELLTAARQGLTRIAASAAYRKSAPLEEMALQEQLYNHYRDAVIPGTQTQPLDLRLEAFSRLADLRPLVMTLPAGTDPEGPAAKQLEMEHRRLLTELERLSDEVRKRRDNFEINFGNAPPKRRALEARRQFGLVREALKVLREADAKDMDIETALWMGNLFLLAGEAENAREVLDALVRSPVDQFPIETQFELQSLSVRTAAALGEYAAAVEHGQTILDLNERPAGQHAAKVIADLILPDMSPVSPLTRMATLPAWGGLWRQRRPAIFNNLVLVGDVALSEDSGRQYGDWLVRQGLLALEAGDVTYARQRLTEATGSKGPRVQFQDRELAFRWLEMWQ